MKNNLKLIREKHNLSVAELARKMGVTRQAVFIHENSLPCTLKYAQKVAEVLNENVFEVLGSSALVLLPTTKKEKDTLIKMIKEL